MKNMTCKVLPDENVLTKSKQPTVTIKVFYFKDNKRKHIVLNQSGYFDLFNTTL